MEYHKGLHSGRLLIEGCVCFLIQPFTNNSTPSPARGLVSLPPRVRLPWNNMPGINTLAHFEVSSKPGALPTVLPLLACISLGFFNLFLHLRSYVLISWCIFLSSTFFLISIISFTNFFTSFFLTKVSSSNEHSYKTFLHVILLPPEQKT